jgi:Uma2 family endonuclease
VEPENLHHAVMHERDVMVFSGRVIAEDVLYADYLSGRYGEHVEWIYGKVIAMAPVNLQHVTLRDYIRVVCEVYADLNGGRVLGDPFVMRAAPDLPARQPDVQVLLPDRMEFLKENQVAGPASLVVEIVSPESAGRDRGEKFREYETGGVGEYWIVDPVRREALFYVRGDDALFHPRPPVDGVYESHVLAGLRLSVDTFWQETLPTTREVVALVEAMLSE